MSSSKPSAWRRNGSRRATSWPHSCPGDRGRAAAPLAVAARRAPANPHSAADARSRTNACPHPASSRHAARCGADVRRAQSRLRLVRFGNGARAEDSIRPEPDGRSLLLVSLPTPGMRLRVESRPVRRPMYTASLLGSDLQRQHAVAAAFAFRTPTSTVLDRLMPDVAPFLLEWSPIKDAMPCQMLRMGSRSRCRCRHPDFQFPVVRRPTPAPTPTPVPLAVPPVVARPVLRPLTACAPSPGAADADGRSLLSGWGRDGRRARSTRRLHCYRRAEAVTLLRGLGQCARAERHRHVGTGGVAALHESGFEIDTPPARRSNVDAGRAADVNRARQCPSAGATSS